MQSLSHPLQFLLVPLAGWINQQQPRFTLPFRETLAATDVQTVRLPARSPSLNNPHRFNC